MYVNYVVNDYGAASGPPNYQCLKVQLDSKKCTERYFKVRDDDLSSKQGSLFTFKLYLS